MNDIYVIFRSGPTIMSGQVVGFGAHFAVVSVSRTICGWPPDGLKNVAPDQVLCTGGKESISSAMDTIREDRVDRVKSGDYIEDFARERVNP